MKPDKEQFQEWLGHPVTEWVLACMIKAANSQQSKWTELAWKGDLDPLLLKEAQVRADCYAALPDSSYEDWEALDDSET